MRGAERMSEGWKGKKKCNELLRKRNVSVPDSTKTGTHCHAPAFIFLNLDECAVSSQQKDAGSLYY